MKINVVDLEDLLWYFNWDYIQTLNGNVFEKLSYASHT